MKRINIILLFAVVFVSCQKRYEVPSLSSFDVVSEKKIYNVGDTVKFKISGEPENIVFWSGEFGKSYENRDRVKAEVNKLIINFRSHCQLGANRGDNSIIHLKVSKDFTGNYTDTDVSGANWINVKDRADWSPGTDQWPSGDVDITDLLSEDEDAYIAFQYDTKVVGNHDQWIIRSFDISGYTKDGLKTSVMTLSDGGWQKVNLLPITSGTVGWTVSSAQLVTNRSNTSPKSDWVISRVFKGIGKIDVVPDKGTTIKNITKNVTEYSYQFEKAGTYKVTFVATNSTFKGIEQKVKEFDIKIE